jgi:hypothetical protein
MEWTELKREFLYAYGTKGEIGATPKEMLIPIVNAMQEQLASGINRHDTASVLIGVKRAFCRPCSDSWYPGITIDEAHQLIEGQDPVRTYWEVESSLIKYYTISMDIEEDKDEFLVGNSFDTSVYLVSRSKNAAWSIPTKRAAGPFASNAL